MDWFTPIDIYCERTGPEFWSEPLNALSNAAFLGAAIWAYIEGKKRDALHWTIVAAIILAGLIAIGSFLFHTFANSWSELTDVIPIWTFVTWFVILSIHFHSTTPNLLRAASVVLGCIGVIGVVIWVVTSAATTDTSVAPGGDGLNGSTQYAPAVIALLIYTIVVFVKKDVSRWWVLGAAVTFAVSLTFRTVDLWICPSFASGTHMFWHLLNGLMIALLLQGMVRHVAPQHAVNMP